MKSKLLLLLFVVLSSFYALQVLAQTSVTVRVVDAFTGAPIAFAA